MPARWLPSLKLPSLSLGRKDATVRRATAVQSFVYGRPYLSNWDTARAVRDGYERVIWVYRCVDVIASNAAGLDLIIRKGHHETGEIQPRHPLLPVLNRQANPFETAETFMYRLVSQYLLSKRGAFVEVTYDRGGNATGLYLLPPHLTNPIPDPDTFVSAYRVQVPGMAYVDVPAVDEYTGKPRVIWVRKPHPLDIYSGVTPLESAGLAIDTDWYARMYNRRFLQNDGRPGGLLAVKGDIEDADAEELRRRFSSGPDGAGRTTVINADEVAWVDTAVKQRDAQYTEALLDTRNSILLAFGVPLSILGDSSGRTYDNADAEKAMYWAEVMLPHLRIIAGAFDPLDGDETLFLSFDTSTVDALQIPMRAKEKHLLELFLGGTISLDEFREATAREPYDTPQARAVWVANQGKLPIAQKGEEDAVNQAVLAATPAPPMLGGGAPGEEDDQKPPAGIAAAGGAAGLADRANRLGFVALPAGRQPRALPAGPQAKAQPERKELALVPDPADVPGVMVAFMLDQRSAEALAIPGGEEPDEMHVTLAYLGKADRVDREALLQAVAAFALTAPPVAGKVSGYGRFDIGDEHALYASVDVPDLPEWRQRLIAALEVFDLHPDRTHGFSPHATLAYVDPDAADPPMPERIELYFDTVTVAVGSLRQSFTLKGVASKAVLAWTQRSA